VSFSWDILVLGNAVPVFEKFFKVRQFVWNFEELRAIKALLYSFVYTVLASLTMQIEVFRGTDISYACPCTVVVLYVTDEYRSRQLGKLTICPLSCTSVIFRFTILAV